MRDDLYIQHANAEAEQNTLSQDVLVIFGTDTRDHNTEYNNHCTRDHEDARTVRVEETADKATLCVTSARNLAGECARYITEKKKTQS